jgi:hypothetical protein
VGCDLEIVNQTRHDPPMPTTGISTVDPADSASKMRAPEFPQIEGRLGSRGDDGGEPGIVGLGGGNAALSGGS